MSNKAAFFKGSIIGQALAEHPVVRKLGFTGSTDTGKIVMRACADSNLKKTSLELGGKSPFIIFSDCDIDRAVRLVSIRHLKQKSNHFKYSSSVIRE